VDPATPATAVLSRMRETHTQTAIVRDDKRRTIGFLTVDDILGALVGGFADEFKAADETAGAPA
jgi:CBS domain containing-hemolysin-like protein